MLAAMKTIFLVQKILIETLLYVLPDSQQI